MEIVIKYFKSFVCQLWGTRSGDNVLLFTGHDPLQDGIGYLRLRLRKEFQVLTENITGYTGTKSTQIFVYANDVATASRNKNALKGTLVNIESEEKKRFSN
jgi:hypothetical protein